MHPTNRSSRQEVFCKKSVLKHFAKFTGKHLFQSLFFNEIAGLRLATLLKKRLWHRCFPVDFTKFILTTFYTEPPVAASEPITKPIALKVLNSQLESEYQPPKKY